MADLFCRIKAKNNKNGPRLTQITSLSGHILEGLEIGYYVDARPAARLKNVAELLGGSGAKAAETSLTNINRSLPNRIFRPEDEGLSR